MPQSYKLVAENPLSTVVAEYSSPYARSEQYQSEEELEISLINQLVRNGYEYASNIKDEDALLANLRMQLSHLNNFNLSDNQWRELLNNVLANKNKTSAADHAQIIQNDYIYPFQLPDGSTRNFYLIDKNNIHNNSLQVINQFATSSGRYNNRYDVSILVNGLPLVHIELKRRGVALKEAFNQIRRYNLQSFGASAALFNFAQIYVISNGTETKYYSNTTHEMVVRSNADKNNPINARKSSDSFEFTSFWATSDNKPLRDIVAFADTFLSRHTLLNILTRYCILTSEQRLMVMRPYQIAATEAILNRIISSSNAKKQGTISAGGFVWHTTGSGKTLTSFITARLATQIAAVDKVLFVVDRNDLDYQTMKEYDRFEKGAANSNSSTAILKKQLEDPQARIIITTIQKLSNFISQNPTHHAFSLHTVLIFDECHRSHFGSMHAAIVHKFKNYHIFGFTGTPITEASATTPSTTKSTFGDQLHAYTIVDAIYDGNVLPFRVDYISTIKPKENIKDMEVKAVDQEGALHHPERIRQIVAYIREHFDQKTKRNDAYASYTYKRLNNLAEVARNKKALSKTSNQQLKGFNSIFTVDSIEAAKLFYNEFKQQMQNNTQLPQLKIATIFSYAPNEDIPDDYTEEENTEDTSHLDGPSRDFLEAAIADYNAQFGTSYDTSGEKFQNYYKDVSLRMKYREIDLLIVVNMFLTGFDAPTLNTLWVDRDLRMHGLLQAFSRTNRILNSVKTFGNIVCFRNLEEATNKSIATFGNKEACGVAILRSYKDYYEGYTDDKGKHHRGYKELIQALKESFPLGERILGEASEKEFIRLFGSILKITNLLSAFDDFAGNEILTPLEQQDYRSLYLDLYDKYSTRVNGDTVSINDDVVFEIELIKQTEIGIDFILDMVKKMQDDKSKDKELVFNEIKKVINSSPQLRQKKELILSFIEQVNPTNPNIDQSWTDYVQQKRREELDQIISDERLKPELTYNFINLSFQNGRVEECGTAIVNLMPPMSLFSKERQITKQRIIDKFNNLLSRYIDICSQDLLPPA